MHKQSRRLSQHKYLWLQEHLKKYWYTLASSLLI